MRVLGEAVRALRNPPVLALTGTGYRVFALLGGLAFLLAAIGFSRRPSRPAARRVMGISLAYLPGLLSLLAFGA